MSRHHCKKCQNHAISRMDSAKYWSTNRYADNKPDIVPKIEVWAKYLNFGRINGALY